MKTATKTNRTTPARASATADEEIQKLDEVVRETHAKWIADHPLPEPSKEELRAEMFRRAEQVLSRHLRELTRNGSVYDWFPRDSEWQIQTLMYQSGVVGHSPAAGSCVFEPSPEQVAAPCFEPSQVDSEGKPCIDFRSRGWRGTLDDLRRQVDSEGKPCIRYTGKRVAALVAKADSDPLAWEAARRVAGHMLEQGDTLPPELNKFAVDVLLDRATKPNRQGRNRGTNAVRDAAIQSAVLLLEEHFGFSEFFPRTRNARKGRDIKDSICDAVAAALRRCGESISYDAVVKIVASLPRPRV